MCLICRLNMIFYNQNDFSKSLLGFLNAIPEINAIDYCKKKKVSYINLASSFDIETSSFYDEHKQKTAIMYIWQFAINDIVILGRTWEDFIKLLNEIHIFYNTNRNIHFVCYIHNLSYEFQFMRKWIEWQDIFATDERKPLYCVSKDGIEFRCSYRLSGYSLATLAKNLTRHTIKKLVGDLDYSLVRTSITPIDNNELQYCINDVLIVTAYINECIEDYGNVAEIPLTQTGKVRRYVRANCISNDNYKYLMKKLTLSSMEYLQLRKAFQGGFTHANSMYSTLKCYDVTSYDFTSSYPTVMLSEKFPMSKSRYIGNCTIEQFEYYRKNYCCMFDLKLENVVSKVRFENVISFSKCFRIEDYVLNNGRVFSAKMLITTITENDFETISKFYNYSNVEIHNLYIYTKEYLPKPFILAILRLYNDKTQLKGVSGKEVEYLHSKEMLNSCYGMTVTDLLNNEYLYDNQNEWSTKETNVDSAIDKYNKDRNRFLFYVWGVWVTAYARRNLFSGIYECKEDYIYSDTDSIKIFNAKKHLDYINKYNVMIEHKLKAMCDYYKIDFNLCKPKTIDGKEKMLGVWDFDGHYQCFKSLGAKRYLTENDNGEISMTVAGVNKKVALPYLIKKYKTNEKVFDSFSNTLVIPKDYSGKKTLTYIDIEKKGVCKDYLGNYAEYNEKSFIHMENAEYNLNIASDYLDFIFRLKNHINNV